MRDRKLTPIAELAAPACCAGTAIAAIAVGGIALASLGQFGLVSATTLVGIVAVTWLIDTRRTRIHDEPRTQEHP